MNYSITFLPYFFAFLPLLGINEQPGRTINPTTMMRMLAAAQRPLENNQDFQTALRQLQDPGQQTALLDPVNTPRSRQVASPQPTTMQANTPRQPRPQQRLNNINPRAVRRLTYQDTPNAETE